MMACWYEENTHQEKSDDKFEVYDNQQADATLHRKMGDDFQCDAGVCRWATAQAGEWRPLQCTPILLYY